MSSSLSRQDNLFTRLSSIEAVTRAFQVFAHGKQVFLWLGCMEAVPALLLGILQTSIQLHTPSTVPGQAAEPPEIGGARLLGLLLLIPVLVMVLLVGAGAVIHATAEIYVGQQPSLRDSLQEGLRRACHLFCFGCLLYLGLIILAVAYGLMIGFVSIISDNNTTALHVVMGISIPILVVLVVYIMVAFQMTPPAVVLEQKSAIPAMERSWELSASSRAYVFCTSFLLGLINYVGIMVMVIVSVILIMGLGPGGMFVCNVLKAAWDVVMVPVSSM